MFMQSSGGLTDAELFQGRDAILSGPAGGVVGMVRTGQDGRLRQADRLRHGRHLHRCLPL
jgi:N-methylhydantoinase A/oxoprolinase/acetone carboxylase beta subunit